jgi:hypothetical protein
MIHLKSRLGKGIMEVKMSHSRLIRIARFHVAALITFVLLMPVSLAQTVPAGAAQPFIPSNTYNASLALADQAHNELELTLALQKFSGVSAYSNFENLVIPHTLEGNNPISEGMIQGPSTQPPELRGTNNNIFITATDPLSNALDVPASYPISATFSQSLDVTSVTTKTFVVQSNFSGRYDGLFNFTNGDTQLQFSKAQISKPGEVLQVSASQEISGSLGEVLQPRVWNFNTATADAGAFMAPHPISPTFGTGNSTAVALGDLDSDGDLDAVIANGLNDAETVWLNDGTGLFAMHPISPTFGAGNSEGIVLGDLDGDGDLDAVVANYFDEPQTVWLNDGSGGFSPHPTAPNFGVGRSLDLALGDLDGDGDLDIVVTDFNQPNSVWLNNGLGSFYPHPTTPLFDTIHSFEVALGDLDGDGDLDAVIAHYYNEPQTVWLNDGSGSLSAHPTAPSFGDGESTSIALGDLDADGDLDAVIANDDYQPQTVWLNESHGVFSAHPTNPSFGSYSSYDVALGDLDGDGDLDAVVANFYGIPETVWINDGTGDFAPLFGGSRFGGDSSLCVALGDLDADGDLDAVVANAGGFQPETVWLNEWFNLIFLPLIEK